MQFDDVLNLLADEPTADLDPAVLALSLASDEYPTMVAKDYLDVIDRFAKRLRPRLVGTLADRIQALGEVLSKEEHFNGDADRYYDPENSYLNRVIDRRLGLPITLSILAAAVGRRAGLNVEGVALPGHFIARATQDQNIIYFDPFHQCRVVEIAECERLAEQATGQPFSATPDDLCPANMAAIARRMLTNLKAIYLRMGDFARAARVIGRIIQLEPANVLERRDLGVCLIKSNQPGRAVELLTQYLVARPQAEDCNVVRQLLRQANAEIARWN